MNRFILAAALLITTLASTMATAKLKVAASTSDLAYFAEVVGGDLVEVDYIAPPNADIHFVEVRPSHMVKVSRADVALKIGLELDMWMDQIIDGSRNGDLRIVDCSQYIEPLEVPSFKADARYGDLHRYGNPHYWLGPQNVDEILLSIMEGFSAADPENADSFGANRDAYLTRLEQDLGELRSMIERLSGVEVVFYHNSWPYFNEFTGLKAVSFVEPYPGVPPSPSHVKKLSESLVERNVKVIAMEPYFDKRVPEKIAAASGAQVIVLFPSIGGRKSGETYIEWFKGNVAAVLDAISQ